MEQREIKFRAWDTRNKTMSFIKIDGIVFHSNPIKNNRIMALADYDFSYYLFKSILFPLNTKTIEENDFQQFILLQCTGLKDKNGKEIYSGDLIKQQDYEEPLEVYFCEDSAGFRAKLKGYRNTEFIRGEECEVIGNIYEK